MNDSDIHNILSKLELDNKHFKFLGVYSCDVPSSVIPSDYVYRYKKLAIVLNTAKEYSLGEHWVCVVFHCDKYILEYYDSSGAKPGLCIQAWLSKLQSRNFENWTCKYNKRVDQERLNECGQLVISKINSIVV